METPVAEHHAREIATGGVHTAISLVSVLCNFFLMLWSGFFFIHFV